MYRDILHLAQRPVPLGTSLVPRRGTGSAGEAAAQVSSVRQIHGARVPEKSQRTFSLRAGGGLWPPNLSGETIHLTCTKAYPFDRPTNRLTKEEVLWPSGVTNQGAIPPVIGRNHETRDPNRAPISGGFRFDRRIQRIVRRDS
jgi:hypothetical protein